MKDDRGKGEDKMRDTYIFLSKAAYHHGAILWLTMEVQ